MTSLLFLIVLLLFVISALCRGVTSGAATAAVPRGKGKGTGLLGHRGSGLLDRLLREVKISFSSELEALTLQVVLTLYRDCAVLTAVVASDHSPDQRRRAIGQLANAGHFHQC